MFRKCFFGFLLASVVGAQSCPERASVGSGGVESNAASAFPALSADGSVVAFASDASNLVPGDNNLSSDIFVRDRRTDVTTRVSVATGGGQMMPYLAGGISPIGASTPAISSDGMVVAFASFGLGLVPNDTNNHQDIFVHDRATGITTRVSVATGGTEANADSFFPAISGNGRYVAFQSAATNLSPNDFNGVPDIFVHDRVTGITTRVSVAQNGAMANGASSQAALSFDGTKVAFSSSASNLVAGDTNGIPDVFVVDLSTGVVTRVSVATGGVQSTGPSSGSGEPSLSADGGRVAFRSYATNLVNGDSNGSADIFVHDLTSSTTFRASVTNTGGQSVGASTSGAAGSFAPRISGDGRYVAFVSHATNLIPNDGNGMSDTFLRDTVSNTTVRMGAFPNGTTLPAGSGYWGSTPSLALSTDGTTVAWVTTQSVFDIDTNGTADVWVTSQKPRLSCNSTVAKGSTLTFNLDAPADAYGHEYYLAVSILTTPSILVGGGRAFPLAADYVLLLSVTPGTPGVVGFHGTLGATTTAFLAIPNQSSVVGLTASASYVIIDASWFLAVRGFSNVANFVMTN